MENSIPHLIPDTEKLDLWNEEKKILNTRKPPEKYINPGEVWYIKMGINIGFEQNGKKQFRRPVLVIKRIGNMYFCIPLTKQGKENSPFYQQISIFGSTEVSHIIVSQGKSFDKKRFMDHLGTVSKTDFEMIKKSLKEIYF